MKLFLIALFFVISRNSSCQLLQHYALPGNHSVDVNTDHNYITDFRAEQQEFFYGDVSTTYNLLELINFVEQPQITSPISTIRMDQRAFQHSADLSGLSERSFGKYMKKTLKQCYVPW